ncbi:MAG TPA: ABC transporter permease [Burkholderiales bacterium]|nr:ABC transporter permease [Burkholderiales bacterium]
MFDAKRRSFLPLPPPRPEEGWDGGQRRVASDAGGGDDGRDDARRVPAKRLGSAHRITPELRLAGAAEAGGTITLYGNWTALGLGHAARDLRKELARYASDRSLRWDLSRVHTLDHVGGLLLWHAWGRRMPSNIVAQEDTKPVFARFQANALPIPQTGRVFGVAHAISAIGQAVLELLEELARFIALTGRVLLDALALLKHPTRWPWLEVSAGVYRAGAQALGITALVGCLIGIILSYLSAQEIREFGLNAYVVNFLGIAIVRELGPLVAAIVVAGRSGSSITAQLGVMRLNDELDALTTKGISYTRRLVLPKVLALALAQPLLIVWTDLFGLLGGMLTANSTLGVSYSYFLTALPKVLPIGNYWVGLAKGVSFGVVIALVACHFGLRIKSNTESLGAGTTSSVVTSITSVIVVDAIFAVLFPDFHR